MVGAFAFLPSWAGAEPSSADCPSLPSTASVIVETNAGPQAISAAQLCAEQSVNAQYYTRAFAGGPAQQDPYVTAGVPLSSVLTLAGVSPPSATFTAVTRADGSWSTWTAVQAAEPTYGVVGLTPVLRLNGDAIDYNRPLLADPSDVNGNDIVATDPGSPLVVTVGSGPLLKVTATADATTVKTGSVVHFTVAATPAGTSPTYTWNFGDGSPVVHGVNVTHSFTASGGYDVLVSASGSGDAQGESSPLVMTVGIAGGSRPPTPTPTPTGAQPGPTRSAPPRPGRSSASPVLQTSSAHPSPVTATAQPTATPSAGPPTVVSRPPPERSPVLAGQAAVRGRLVANGDIVALGSSDRDAPLGSGATATLSVRGRAEAIAGVVAAILALVVAGAARELGWFSDRRRKD